MQTRIIQFLLGTLMLPVLLVPAACERVASQGTDGEPLLVSRARMDVAIDRWDATKADGTDSWPDYAIIFVQLTNGKQTLPVEAQRNPGGDWTINRVEPSVQGGWETSAPDLTGFSGGYCKCYYFEGDSGTNGQYFDRQYDGKIKMIGAQSAIYHDDDAIFSIVDGVLELKAHLEPMTGRIRFGFAPGGDTYYYPGIYGMLRYTALNRESFEMESSSSYFNYYMGADGEAPYVYGRFADADRRTLTVVDAKWGNPTAYERSFDEDILAPGCSNFAYMPGDNDHNEWYRYDGFLDGWQFDVEGLSMFYVVPGFFMMGGEDARPIHKVTLTRGFYLSQTEITKDMWYRVMGEPSDYANAAVPVTGRSWDEVQAFIAALNAKTGYSFRLPTEAEWEYAARGGQKSNGYLYSGGNTFADVAVRDGNWSMQAVRTKSPNELDFYDMSGNASEWVSDWYGPYPSDAVVDPKGPETGEIHIRRGGNRAQGAEYLTVSFRDTDSPFELTGFRLVLDAPRIQ